MSTFTSSPAADLDRYLQPIAGENPAGADLRWDDVYNEIKKARRQDDRDMLGLDDEAQTDWSQVEQLAGSVLAERSKDLMVAAWLTESFVHRHGFAGLRQGLQLLTELLERFWEQVYPTIDGDDLEPRVAPLVWLTDADRGARLPNCLRDVPLTPDAAERFSWNYWKSRYPKGRSETESDDSYIKRKTEAEERGKKFEDAVAQTPRDFVQRTFDDIVGAIAALKRFEQVVEQRFPKHAPSIVALRQALEECQVLVQRILRDKGGAMAGDQANSGEGLNGHAGDAPARGAAMTYSGPISSRDDAFRRLAEIAEFLRHTEPQSPVSYLIQRAVTWGRMPFEQLLGELIRDATARDQVGELLGIKNSADTSNA